MSPCCSYSHRLVIFLFIFLFFTLIKHGKAAGLPCLADWTVIKIWKEKWREGEEGEPRKLSSLLRVDRTSNVCAFINTRTCSGTFKAKKTNKKKERKCSGITRMYVLANTRSSGSKSLGGGSWCFVYQERSLFRTTCMDFFFPFW